MNAKELLEACEKAALVNGGGSEQDRLFIRALRLLAAAEAGEGEVAYVISRLRDVKCAPLHDDAIALIESLAARVGELSAEVERSYQRGYYAAAKRHSAELTRERSLATASEAELASLRERLKDAEKDAERGRWLVEWLAQNNLLTAMNCKPSADAPNGDYWILRTPAVVNGDSCVGYGKTEDAAIDAAREGK